MIPGDDPVAKLAVARAQDRVFRFRMNGEAGSLEPFHQFLVIPASYVTGEHSRVA